MKNRGDTCPHQIMWSPSHHFLHQHGSLSQSTELSSSVCDSSPPAGDAGSWVGDGVAVGSGIVIRAMVVWEGSVRVSSGDPAASERGSWCRGGRKGSLIGPSVSRSWCRGGRKGSLTGPSVCSSSSEPGACGGLNGSRSGYKHSDLQPQGITQGSEKGGGSTPRPRVRGPSA